MTQLLEKVRGFLKQHNIDDVKIKIKAFINKFHPNHSKDTTEENADNEGMIKRNPRDFIQKK